MWKTQDDNLSEQSTTLTFKALAQVLRNILDAYLMWRVDHHHSYHMHWGSWLVSVSLNTVWAFLPGCCQNPFPQGVSCLDVSLSEESFHKQALITTYSRASGSCPAVGRTETVITSRSVDVMPTNKERQTSAKASSRTVRQFYLQIGSHALRLFSCDHQIWAISTVGYRTFDWYNPPPNFMSCICDPY